MSSTPPRYADAALNTTQVDASAGAVNLSHQESRYWYLLASICIVTTAGLAFAMAPLLGEHIAGLWPWANTHIILTALLPLSMALLVGYLTIQKHLIL